MEAELGRTVLVTGASGFVGRQLCVGLGAGGWRVRAALRRPPAGLSGAGDAVLVGDIGPDTDWREALAGADAVIHLAARVHVMRETAADPAALFDRVNVAGTETLVRQAAAAGVRRFVFVSSIKVNGEATSGRPFTENDPPRPLDPYGASKWKAEQAIRSTAAASGMEFVILRPPLIYGPGVKANFLRLLQAVDRGLPLPFGRADNRRSLISVGNLVAFLAAATASDAVANETFLVSDGHDLSTADLVRAMAKSLGRPARLVPVPPGLLEAAGRLTGRAEAVQRLFGSLQVDIAHARRRFGFDPPVSVAQAMDETAAWYRRSRREAAGG
jgi:nucleoside-diphosphate-sugar epimerase